MQGNHTVRRTSKKWSGIRGRGYKGLSAHFGGSPILGVTLAPDKVQKKLFENFHFWWFASQKNSQICPNIAYMVQKVGSTAIIILIWAF